MNRILIAYRITYVKNEDLTPMFFARLGVAVTFQACLHLDVSGKVVLFQGVDDVLVKPKG